MLRRLFQQFTRKGDRPSFVLPKRGKGTTYNHDGLATRHNHDFMTDPEFLDAYRRGVMAAGKDYFWYWRVHVGLWAARSAARLPGDFVECGVNRGFLSSSIMHMLNWDSLDKTFFLLDTFNGLDEQLVSNAERQDGALKKNRRDLEEGFYVRGSDIVRDNFSEWKNVCIIEGVVPDTLSQVQTGKVAFLHLDMNCAEPEVAAANYFWDKLVPGALVLLDDYAFEGFIHQKKAMDAFAREKNIDILSLPTGQGLLIAP